MIPLRKSTASQEVLLGPFLDDTDGKTAETGLTIANTDIKLWKRGGTTESNKNSGGATHIADGRYYAVLDATDTDTTGELILNVAVAGALPVRLVCCVFEAAVFDSLFASGAAGYQVPIWSSASATVNLSGTTIKAVTDAIVLPSSASINITGNITGNLSGSVGSVTGSVGSVTGNVGGSVASVTGAVGSVTGNVGGNVTGSVGSVASGVTVTTNNDKAGYSLTQAFPSNFASLAINASGHISRVTLVDTCTANTDMRGTDGAALASIWTSTVAGRIDAAISTRSSHSAADVWSVATRTLTAFSFSVTVGTNNDKTGYSLATSPLDASGTAAAVWGALLSSYTSDTTFGGRILRTDQASSGNGAKVTSAGHVAADIHELQPAVIQSTHFDLGAIDANALAADAAAAVATAVRSELATELGRIDATTSSRASQTSVDTLTTYVDTEVAAIKAKTDALPANPAATSDIPSAITIADAVLNRSVANVESSAAEHTLCTLVLAALEGSISGTTWTIKRSNGSTTHYVKTVTADANASPIVGVQ